MAQAEAREPGPFESGAASVPRVLRAPYTAYERAILATLRPGMRILELGSGTGRHSVVLAGSGSEVTCTDVSAGALALLSKRMSSLGRTVRVVPAPMEATPFPDSTFDLAASAGSLSYADPMRLDPELVRILKPGGSFICVDSLNHNPVYRLNRWVHWRIRGNRTRSTLLRMPTLTRMEQLGHRFERWSLRGFGAWSWIWTPMSRIIGHGLAARCNDACDGLPGSRRLSFKFVFEAHGLRK
jgi:ubiquinone/menaquinone biosynthesis C-methylase UbiE